VVLRTARVELGVFAMLVDAKDEAAQRFYEHYGFTLLPAGSVVCAFRLRRRYGRSKRQTRHNG
jgi:hypothetical protein